MFDRRKIFFLPSLSLSLMFALYSYSLFFWMEVAMSKLKRVPTKSLFIDEKGNVISSKNHDFEESQFSEGLAVFSEFKKQKKYGYIDLNGKVKIPAKFDKARAFSDGLAQVTFQGEKAYINKKGEIVAEFVAHSDDSEGLIPFTSGKWGFSVVSKNEKHINAQFEWAMPFKEGLAAVRLGGKWGYVNKKGEITISPRFNSAQPFKNNLAWVFFKNKWQLINKKGELIQNGPQDKIFVFYDQSGIHYFDSKWIVINKYSSKSLSWNELEFSEGLAKVGSPYGFINKKVDYIIPKTFPAAFPFRETLAAVMNKDSYWGFINKSGKMVVNHRYGEVKSFSDGKAAVLPGKWKEIPGGISLEGNQKWGFIDKNGKVVIDFSFYNPKSFSQGLAGVGVIRQTAWMKGHIRKKNRWGYINHVGKFVIQPQFRDGGEFSEGLAVFLDNKTSRWGYINKSGKVVIKPKFFFARSFHEGRALADIETGEPNLRRDNLGIISD